MILTPWPGPQTSACAQHGRVDLHLPGRESPEDFEQMATEMTPYLAPHQLNQCKVAAQVDLVEDCNWKLTMENNRECYHCMSNHPELTISLYEYGFGYQPDEHNAAGLQRFQDIMAANHERWEGMGLPSAEIDTLDDRITGFRTQRLPIDRSGQSQTMNAEVASKNCWPTLSIRPSAACRSGPSRIPGTTS